MESIWTDTVTLQKSNALMQDMETETAVIGAGLTGILTAYVLKEKGIDVVILEADRTAGGQTRGTTAKITSQHNLIYHDLIQAYGFQKAKHYAGFQEWAVGEYENIVRKEKIDCNFTRCPANLYSCAETEPLEREAEAAGRLGIKASFKTQCGLPFAVKGVLEYENQAKFHPLKFIKGLEKDLRIFEKTFVRDVRSEGPGKSRIITDRGIVTAKNVVFACHFPFINMPGYYFARMYQSRSYVLALKNAEKFSGYYLGIDRDGYSLRNEGDVLLFGGGGHRTGRSADGGGYGQLSHKAKTLWPDSEETGRWSAQDCMTLDKIPYIGAYSRRRNGWYVATGFGKWGMTSAMVSARIISSMIEGINVPEADVFSPQRKVTPMGVKNFAKSQTVAVKNLISTKDTKRCPHLGCKLSWNADEGTWDCPCHGSRFDREGNILDNPAVREIKS